MRIFPWVLFSASLFSQTIPTDHFDNSRLSWNSSESILTPSIITTAAFGKRGAFLVDGAVYAQPIYLSGVSIGGAVHNALIVATMQGSVYAFDVQAPATALWHASLSSPRTTYPDTGFLYHQPVGCLATPVVDVANAKVYAVCTNTTPTWVLYQINLSDGSLAGSVTLSGSSGGETFNPGQELARSGLTLANGNVYVAFAGYDDQSPWHGWLFGYSTSSLSQIGIFCTTPGDTGGGIWQANGGLAVDGSGNLYAATGNGGWNGSTVWGNSLLKFDQNVNLIDWYTPTNWATLESKDLDISSGRPMLIPNTNLIVVGFKDFNVYSMNRNCLGHLGGTVGCSGPQVFITNASGVPGEVSGIYGGAFMNGMGYWPNTSGKVYAFSLSGSTWNTTSTTTAATFVAPGAQMSGSSNGASNGILWALTFSTSAFNSPQPVTLRAFDPVAMTEISNWSIGNGTKFSSPTIANGNVFVSTFDDSVVMFGLAPSVAVSGQVTVSGGVTIH